jgi:hypothetical protein
VVSIRHDPPEKKAKRFDFFKMTSVFQLGNRMAMKERRKVSNEVAMVHILTIFFYCALTMSIIWALTIAFR